MNKFRKDTMVRHSPNIEGYFAITNKKGDRTELKVQVPNEYVSVLRTPNNWETLYKDSKVKLRSCIASSGSKYAVEGERVFELIFKDGQKIRYEKGSLPERTLRNVNLVVNKKLNGS